MDESIHLKIARVIEPECQAVDNLIEDDWGTSFTLLKLRPSGNFIRFHQFSSKLSHITSDGAVEVEYAIETITLTQGKTWGKLP